MPAPISTADWQTIRRHFRRSFSTNLHVAIASVGADGQPTVTPIGSLLLNRDTTSGIFIEIFTSSISKNALTEPRVCVMAVNSGKWLWLKSLLKGSFAEPPMIKLYGTIGVRRAAKPEEIARFKRRFGFLIHTPGGKKLWGNLQTVREIHFEGFEWVKLGQMSA